MAVDFSYPSWLKPSTEPWQVIAQTGQIIGNALARNREFQFQAKQVEQDNVLRMRDYALREQAMSLSNQARLQEMNLREIEFQRDSAGQPLLEQYQRTLMTWDGKTNGEPPLPPNLPPRLMSQAIAYRNQVMQSEAMIERKRILGQLGAAEMKIQNDKLESAQRLEELTGIRAIEYHPQFGPRVNDSVLAAGWQQYRGSTGGTPSGMTPTAMQVPLPGGKGYTRFEVPKQPTITMTLDKYKLTEFPKRKADYRNSIDRKLRAMTDDQIISEIEGEYRKLAPAAATTSAAPATPTPSYRVGQKAIQDGQIYEFNGVDWVEVR